MTMKALKKSKTEARGLLRDKNQRTISRLIKQAKKQEKKS